MARRSLVRNLSVGARGLLKRTAIQPLQCVTVDVTGTLMGYKGVLGDYYCMAAKAAGLPCPDYDRMHQGFKVAYKEMDKKYPCFGKLHDISNTVWWQMVVRNSFREAGYDYDDKAFEIVFNRIYAIFGSAAPYTLYEDAKPFLKWVRSQGILVGVVSNASYRYRDVILPLLGLNQGQEWDFGVFSGIEGVQKPDPEIFKIALKRANQDILPEQALHIGDSLQKDFVPATSLSMHALLLDRFNTVEAFAAKETGVPVVTDLHEAKEYIIAFQEQAHAAAVP